MLHASGPRCVVSAGGRPVRGPWVVNGSAEGKRIGLRFVNGKSIQFPLANALMFRCSALSVGSSTVVTTRDVARYAGEGEPLHSPFDVMPRPSSSYGRARPVPVAPMVWRPTILSSVASLLIRTLTWTTIRAWFCGSFGSR